MLNNSKSYKNFTKILKQSGASVNGVCFQWMFDDESVPGHKLLHWIAENITSDNYLNITEQREYYELQSRGDYLTSTELTEAIDSIESEYPGLFDENLGSLEYGLLDHVELINKQTDILQQCIKDYESSNNSYDILNNQHIKSKLKLQAIEEECKKMASNLEEYEGELTYTMQKIQQLYDNKKSGHIFLNQMDLESLTDLLQSKCSYTKLYLERQFPNKSNVTHEKTDLMMLYERLVDCFYSEMYHKAELEAWKSCVDEFPLTYNKFNLITNVEKEIECLTMSIMTLEGDEQIHLDAMKSAAERYSLQLLMKVQYQDNEHKLAKRKLAYEKLVEIESFLENTSYTWEILWRMMSIEGNCIEQVQSLFRDIKHKNKVSNRNVVIRIYDLKKLIQIQSQESYVENNFALNNLCLQLLVDHNIKHEYFEEHPNLIYIFQKLISDTDVEIDIYRKKLNNTADKITEIESVIKSVQNEIFCGISKSPICISPAHYSIYKCKRDLSDLETSIMSAKNAFVIKKQSLRSSIVLEAQRKLWVYFLCEPKKVLTILDNVKTFAKDNSMARIKNRTPV